MTLRVEHQGDVVRLTLDRPKVKNAFDEALIAELTAAFEAAGRDEAVRAVILAADGAAFCAGADLAWMQRQAAAGDEENLADARRLAALMQAIDTCPKPTIARVQGSAFGGGLGLIGCCDIAVGVPGAQFAVSEVRLGLIPAVISPYLLRAMGPRIARRLFLTAERFSAEDALRYGLLHEVVTMHNLDATIERHVAAVRAGGPQALAEAKHLAADMAGPINAALVEETARRIAAIRATPEAREGLDAFFARRKPGWTP